MVSGQVQGVGTSKDGDVTYVRFAGAQGQVAVTARGLVWFQHKDALVVGREVTIFCDARPGRDGGIYLEAVDIFDGRVNHIDPATGLLIGEAVEVPVKK